MIRKPAARIVTKQFKAELYQKRLSENNSKGKGPLSYRIKIFQKDIDQRLEKKEENQKALLPSSLQNKLVTGNSTKSSRTN